MRLPLARRPAAAAAAACSCWHRCNPPPPLHTALPQLVRQLLAKNNSVIATARKPEAASDLHKLQASAGGRLSVTKLDVTSPQSIESWAAGVKALTPHVDVSGTAACMTGWCSTFLLHGWRI